MKTTTLMPESRNLDYAAVWETLVQQISDYAENAWAEWYVMGVSGGVDSSLVSTLCAETGKPLHVLSMPIHQNPEELDRATEHIEWLQNKYKNVTSDIIDLTWIYDVSNATLKDGPDEAANRIAYANLRSRIRMIALYDVANKNNLLVAGTGNLIEDFWIGFFTKFGDGWVDVSIIWELYKSEVRALLAFFEGKPNLVNAIATDGLHEDGATDEDQIGANYDELEWALQKYDLWKRAEHYEWRAKKVMEIYTSRHEWNAHKMDMPPVFKIAV